MNLRYLKKPDGTLVLQVFVPELPLPVDKRWMDVPTVEEEQA